MLTLFFFKLILVTEIQKRICYLGGQLADRN